MTNTYNMIQKNEYICIYFSPFSWLKQKDPRMFPNDLTKLCLDKRGVGSFFIAHTEWLG